MFNMVLSNYSMPDSSKLNSSTTSSRKSTKKTEKIKEKPPSPKKESIDKELEASIISKKELEEQEYQKELREKKLKEALEEKKYRDISVRISPQENFFCLAVDGSQTSKDAFEIILTEFFPRIHDSVLICPHIYNNTQDENFNWRYQKQYVIDYYKTRLITSIADRQGYLIIQDRDLYKVHEIEQAYKIAEVNNSKYFFCGYDGLREQGLKPSRIDVGLEYLLGESKMPIIIMKDKHKRGVKNQGYKWLLIMDRSNSDCLKVLDLFLPLIDKEKDRIYGLTLMPPFVAFDDIKTPFYEKMKELNFFEGEQFEYSFREYKSNPLPILTEFVNHNPDHYFDFVIFLNNPAKFKMQKKECHTFKYIKLLFANICFCNFAYLEGYDYNVISKLPNEIDERKYLAQFDKIDSEDIKKAITGKEDKKENNENEENKIINEDNIDESNKNDDVEVIPSEIYGVSHGQFVEMKKHTDKEKEKENNSIKTASTNKTNPISNNNNKADNKKPIQPKKNNVTTKTNTYGSKNSKSTNTTTSSFNKYNKGKPGKK